MNIQENTNKTPIFAIYQMNGDVVVVCHHIGATIVIVWHCLGIYQADEHPQHVSSSLDHTFTASDPDYTSFPANFQETSELQMVICHHVGATIVVVWCCLSM